MELDDILIDDGEIIEIDGVFIYKNDHAYVVISNSTCIALPSVNLYINNSYYKCFTIDSLSGYSLSDFNEGNKS